MNALRFLSLFAISLTVVLATFGFASALQFDTAPSTLTITQNSTNFQLGASENTTITSLVFSDSTISQIGGSIAFKILPQAPFTIGPNSPKQLTASVSSSLGPLTFGTYTTTLTAFGTYSNGTTVNASIPVKFVQSFCKNGAAGTNLSISGVTVRNSGTDDTTWEPLDDVTVKVDVDNNGLGNMKDVNVYLALYDSEGRNKITTLNFLTSDAEKTSLGTIKDGGTEKTTFEFTVPVDLKEGTYKLAVKAFSKGSGEAIDCADYVSGDFDQGYYQTIDIQKKTKNGELITIDNFNAPDQNVCGTSVSGSFDVLNVGDTDQDQVLVHMTSKELGLDQQFEIKENLNTGESNTLNYNFDLPRNIQDGSYKILFRPSYDYRNGAYHQSASNEVEEIIHVIGCSNTGNGNSGNSDNAAISATLGSDAKAGQKLVISAVIRNLATTQQTFVVDATGYQSWATLDSISDRIITLNAGESKSVAISLNVDAAAKSPQEFTIQTVSNGKTTSQVVDVKLAENTSSSFSLSGNGLIWVIGAINLVLIILIIVVAIRVSRK